MTGLEMASSLVELAGAVREITRKEPSDRTAAKKVVEALRTIYFTPDGVLSLIEQLANGERPSAERIAAILPTFNDKEWRIIGEIKRLDFATLYENGDLSIKQCRILEEIGWGKKNLRAAIQDFLNEALTGDDVPPAIRAKELLDEVRRLNSLIEDAEENLR